VEKHAVATCEINRSYHSQKVGKACLTDDHLRVRTARIYGTSQLNGSVSGLISPGRLIERCRRSGKITKRRRYQCGYRQLGDCDAWSRNGDLRRRDWDPYVAARPFLDKPGSKASGPGSPETEFLALTATAQRGRPEASRIRDHWVPDYSASFLGGRLPTSFAPINRATPVAPSRRHPASRTLRCCGVAAAMRY
jgi:hypothetical protein